MVHPQDHTPMNVPETLKMNTQLKMSLAWELHKGGLVFLRCLQDLVQRGGNHWSVQSCGKKYSPSDFFVYLLH